MTQIKAPTGFISTLKSALKSASTEGKPVGAPALKKALKGADAGKLDSQQKSQIRDAFERVKLTPKAREIADRFVKGDKKPLNPHDGIKKIRSDDPIKTEGSGSGIPGGGIKKIRSDDPIKTEGPGSGIKFPDDGVIVKIISDDPIRGPQQPPELKPLEPRVVKVMMDDPIGSKQTPEFKPLDPRVVKVRMDSPI